MPEKCILACDMGTKRYGRHQTSARHADQESADVYKRDATTLLEYAKKNFTSLSEVTPTWKPVLVQTYQMARLIMSRNRNHSKPVHELAHLKFNGLYEAEMDYPEYCQVRIGQGVQLSICRHWVINKANQMCECAESS